MTVLDPQEVVVSSSMAEKEALSPQQHYQKEMESIWERVNGLPNGQNRVVLHQLMQFGKIALHPSPREFPALATYGFILEHAGGAQFAWLPFTPHLKDFCYLGIRSSFEDGYALHSRQVFQINLQAKIQMMPSAV